MDRLLTFRWPDATNGKTGVEAGMRPEEVRRPGKENEVKEEIAEEEEGIVGEREDHHHRDGETRGSKGPKCQATALHLDPAPEETHEGNKLINWPLLPWI